MRNALILAAWMVAGLPLGAVSAETTSEGLLGHWTFDRLADGRTEDASPNARHAQVHGATATEGVRGKALGFDGDGDFVSLGDLGEHDAVTMAFWVKGQDDGRRDRWQGLVTSDGWEPGVFHIPLGDRAVDVFLHLGGGARGRLSGPKLKDGRWHHVAVTADTKAHAIRLFINGYEVDSDDISEYSGKIKLLDQVVGRESKSEGFTRYFRGAIDDVRIYASALGADRVRALCPGAPEPPGRDPRNIRTGLKIPDEGYCDQPYVVVTQDGNWLCTLTTGSGHEGQGGQHVVATISTDQGRTWTAPVDIEPADGPEASWVVPLLVPSGRVYAFYTYNGDRVATLRGKRIRADMLGWYVYKFSDDGGRTWSNERYRLPYRLSACDRTNDWQGKVQIFWGIDKPKVSEGTVFFASTKLGRYMLEQGEGWLFRSDNILTESDPAKIDWELLPEGEHGIRADEFGSVQEEHNMVPLGEGQLYCVYRTTTGYPCHTYSRDGGRTWSKPEHMTYTPGGRKIKNPRACPKLWKTKNGHYLFWFHNHSGKSFAGRNPVWLTGGRVKDGRLHWSQPEILLYDPNVSIRMSYPDLIEQDGRYWVTETQKTIARIHELDPSMLEGLWNQGKARSVSREGLVAEVGKPRKEEKALKWAKPLDPSETGGLSLDFWVQLDSLDVGQVVFDSRGPKGNGILVETTDGGAIRLVLGDGKTQAAWQCDAGLLTPGKLHHVVATVDAGPKILTFVVDGQLCDGGEERQYGWGRYQGDLGDVSGTGVLRLGPSLRGDIARVRVYNRPLRTSEAVAHFHAGP